MTVQLRAGPASPVSLRSSARPIPAERARLGAMQLPREAAPVVDDDEVKVRRAAGPRHTRTRFASHRAYPLRDHPGIGLGESGDVGADGRAEAGKLTVPPDRDPVGDLPRGAPVHRHFPGHDDGVAPRCRCVLRSSSARKRQRQQSERGKARQSHRSVHVDQADILAIREALYTALIGARYDRGSKAGRPAANAR